MCAGAARARLSAFPGCRQAPTVGGGRCTELVLAGSSVLPRMHGTSVKIPVSESLARPEPCPGPANRSRHYRFRSTLIVGTGVYCWAKTLDRDRSAAYFLLRQTTGSTVKIPDYVNSEINVVCCL